MIREIYAGRKLTARKLKGRDFGRVQATLNGHVSTTTGTSEQAALDYMKRQIDEIDAWTAAHGIDGDRWTAEWFVPGTFETCSLGLHPREIGGVCKHFWCAKHRCQWDMPDDEQPDSEQCVDTAIDDRLYCQAHADEHDDLMDRLRDSEGAYTV